MRSQPRTVPSIEKAHNGATLVRYPLVMAVEDTWHSREMPVLLAIYEIEKSRSMLNTSAMAEALGIPEADVRDSVAALADAGYILPAKMARTRSYGVIARPHLSERGRRTIGQWPEDGYTALVTLLEARIAATTDQAERGKLEGFLKGLVGMGRDVATDVLSALARDLAGLR